MTLPLVTSDAFVSGEPCACDLVAKRTLGFGAGRYVKPPGWHELATSYAAMLGVPAPASDRYQPTFAPSSNSSTSVNVPAPFLTSRMPPWNFASWPTPKKLPAIEISC